MWEVQWHYAVGGNPIRDNPHHPMGCTGGVPTRCPMRSERIATIALLYVRIIYYRSKSVIKSEKPNVIVQFTGIPGIMMRNERYLYVISGCTLVRGCDTRCTT